MAKKKMGSSSSQQQNEYQDRQGRDEEPSAEEKARLTTRLQTELDIYRWQAEAALGANDWDYESSKLYLTAHFQGQPQLSDQNQPERNGPQNTQEYKKIRESTSDQWQEHKKRRKAEENRQQDKNEYISELERKQLEEAMQKSKETEARD